MSTHSARGDDFWRAGLAIGAAVEIVIAIGRSMSDQAKRDTALAIAMGVMHGCCGPNGDFTSDFRPQEPASERANRGDR